MSYSNNTTYPNPLHSNKEVRTPPSTSPSPVSALPTLTPPDLSRARMHPTRCQHFQWRRWLLNTTATPTTAPAELAELS